MIGLQANVFISVTNQSDFSLFLYSTYKHLFVIKKRIVSPSKRSVVVIRMPLYNAQSSVQLFEKKKPN